MAKASRQPHVVVIGGPNGAGKSTTAPALVRDLFGLSEFVNPDLLSEDLSAFEQGVASWKAGRIILRRIRRLGVEKRDFAFETTLASLTFAPWLRKLQEDGYLVHVFFLWLPDADHAVARVAGRVRIGGHDVPEPVVRRRYGRSLRNLAKLYLPLADSFHIFDNTLVGCPRLVAYRSPGERLLVIDENIWAQIEKAANGEEGPNS